MPTSPQPLCPLAKFIGSAQRVLFWLSLLGDVKRIWDLIVGHSKMLPASFLPVFLRSSVARGWGYVGKRCQKSSDDPLWRQGLNTQLSLVNQALHEIFPKAFSPLSLPPPLLFCSCCKYVEKKRLWYKKVLLCCGRKGAQGRIKQPRPQKGSEGTSVLSGPSFPGGL